ncbi:MAG: hypothetical protein HC925_00960 [Coleofasciculaceae cyanobacterium SM2_3_26]|nr:hypothetical protein [Coleofasciculaceae cyanobacterium SM2_3_26]
MTEFRYGQRLGEQFRQVQDKKLSDLRTFGEGNSWQLMPSEKAIAFTDNHDNQRGHGAGGYDSLVMFYRPDRTTYALANVFMLAHPYGYPKVMSSYDWERQIINNQDKNDWIVRRTIPITPPKQ